MPKIRAHTGTIHYAITYNGTLWTRCDGRKPLRMASRPVADDVPVTCGRCIRSVSA